MSENRLDVSSAGYPMWGMVASGADTVTANRVGCIGVEVAKAEADIRQDVRDSEAAVRHDINQSEAQLNKHLADSDRFNAREFCDLNANVKDAECSISDKVQTAAWGINNHISNMERSVDSQFCTTNSNIKDEGYRTRHQMLEFERNVDKNFCETRESVLREHYETRKVVAEQNERARAESRHQYEEIREDLNANNVRNLDEFRKLSEQHLAQQLAAVKDELSEERLKSLRLELINKCCCGPLVGGGK